MTEGTRALKALRGKPRRVVQGKLLKAAASHGTGACACLEPAHLLPCLTGMLLCLRLLLSRCSIGGLRRAQLRPWPAAHAAATACGTWSATRLLRLLLHGCQRRAVCSGSGSRCRQASHLPLGLPQLLLQRLQLLLLLGQLLLGRGSRSSCLLPQRSNLGRQLLALLSLLLATPLRLVCRRLRSCRRLAVGCRGCLQGSQPVLCLTLRLGCHAGAVLCRPQLLTQRLLRLPRHLLLLRCRRRHRLNLPQQRPSGVPRAALQRLRRALCLPQPLLKVCSLATQLCFSVSPVCSRQQQAGLVS